jgi:DNA-binding MarR family transcriptional regulator
MIEVEGGALAFGDWLALARRTWVRAIAARLAPKGFAEYRRSDAYVTRVLQLSALSLGTLGAELSMTRQGARKVVDGLVARGYARIHADEVDARKSMVELTPSGRDYARAIVSVIATMNDELLGIVGKRDLETATRLLELVHDNFAAATTSTNKESAAPKRRGSSYRRSIRSM